MKKKKIELKKLDLKKLSISPLVGNNIRGGDKTYPDNNCGTLGGESCAICPTKQVTVPYCPIDPFSNGGAAGGYCDTMTVANGCKTGPWTICKKD